MAMESFRIPGTERSPDILFDVERRLVRLSGESYPEDASAVFAPLFAALTELLDTQGADPLRIEVQLAYFNSSSAKALMNLFLTLERAAARGLPETVTGAYAPDDDTMKEFGEDFSEDLDHIAFTLVAVESAA